MDTVSETELTFSIQNWYVVSGQSRLCFYTNKQGRPTSRGNTLPWEVFGLEAKSKRSFLHEEKNC